MWVKTGRLHVPLPEVEAPEVDAEQSRMLSRRCATCRRLISAGRGNFGAPPNPPSVGSKRSASWLAHPWIAWAACPVSKVLPSAAFSSAASQCMHRTCMGPLNALF